MVIANKPDYFFYISGSRPRFGYKNLSPQIKVTLQVLFYFFFFLLVTVHCAFFTYLVSDELNKAHIIKKSLLQENVKLKIIQNSLILTSKGEISDGIVSDYFKDLIGLKKNGVSSHSQILDSYLKKTVGYYEFGWFCSDVMLKLGLIGTVIGFIIMLSSLSDITTLTLHFFKAF